MPAPSDEPIRRVTLNLYIRDANAMEWLYGRGWTEQVRRLVREHLRTKNIPKDRYLGAKHG